MAKKVKKKKNILSSIFGKEVGIRKTDGAAQAQRIISNHLQLTSICGISIKGLSAKYAYSALKTAYIKINKFRLWSYSIKDEFKCKIGSSHIKPGGR